MLICPLLLDVILADLCAKSNQLSSSSTTLSYSPMNPLLPRIRQLPLQQGHLQLWWKMRETSDKGRQKCSQSDIYKRDK